MNPFFYEEHKKRGIQNYFKEPIIVPRTQYGNEPIIIFNDPSRERRTRKRKETQNYSKEPKIFQSQLREGTKNSSKHPKRRRNLKIFKRPKRGERPVPSKVFHPSWALRKILRHLRLNVQTLSTKLTWTAVSDTIQSFKLLEWIMSSTTSKLVECCPIKPQVQN